MSTREAYRHHYTTAFMALLRKRGITCQEAHTQACDAATLAMTCEEQMFGGEEQVRAVVRGVEQKLLLAMEALHKHTEELAHVRGELELVREDRRNQEAEVASAEEAFIELSRLLWPSTAVHGELLDDVGLDGALVQVRLHIEELVADRERYQLTDDAVAVANGASALRDILWSSDDPKRPAFVPAATFWEAARVQLTEFMVDATRTVASKQRELNAKDQRIVELEAEAAALRAEVHEHEDNAVRAPSWAASMAQADTAADEKLAEQTASGVFWSDPYTLAEVP